MSEVLDRSYDDDGNITQFLLLEEGQPVTKLATPENLLLYDPEDELPFDGGMNDFLSGESALRLSEEPLVVVAQASDVYSYIVNVGGDVIETTPDDAERLLTALYDSIVESDTKSIRDIHANVMSTQVRQNLINTLHRTFDESHRVEIAPNGWLVDGFFVVDWNAKLYASNDDPDEGDYVRSGQQAVKKDTSYEFVRLHHRLSDVDVGEVFVNGESYSLTEREQLFLAKITWLLNRRHYHPDEAFWNFADKWTDVPEEEPNLDQFNI